MIVGSRGDVQPYLALGQQLRKDGHRVRLATHETFREVVQEAGLEFFNIGGNPQDLMSYMVKNPGLIPGFASLTNGDIVKKRKMLTEMIHGCWKACHSPSPEGPFIADAIISNPPAFAHIHCAEALGVPLLLSFTIPWSPTTSFPHPLVNLKCTNAKAWSANILSYTVSEMLQWQGVGDIINHFRTKTLGLSPLTLRLGVGLVDRLQIPWTYCMSPSLVPKPRDWQNFIDVVGFYFLDLATRFKPEDDLIAFLKAGSPPVYIGFGSVVVDDPKAMTETIFEATKQAGVRALVSAGWGGLGGTTIPEHIFILGNVPHDWLFDDERVIAVVHHGGAGTTAIGLAKGRPTVVVPFFGDQGFWGSMIHKAGAGPKPIPHKELTVKILREAIKFVISAPAKAAAGALADKIRHEDGARKGAESFYKHLPLLNMRCDLDPSATAVWWSQEHFMKLSNLAAQVLVEAKIISINSLILHRSKEYRATKMLTPSGIYATATSLFGNLKSCPITIKNHGIRGVASSVTDIYQQVKLLADAAKLCKKDKKDKRKKEKSGGAAAIGTPSGTDVISAMEGPSKNRDVADAIHAEDDSTMLKTFEDENLGLHNGSEEHAKEGLHKVVTTAKPQKAVEQLARQLCISPEKVSSQAKRQFDRIRLTRIEQGCEAFKLSTNVERAKILQRFEEGRSELPKRRLMYKNLLGLDWEGLDVESNISGATPLTSPSITTSGHSRGASKSSFDSSQDFSKLSLETSELPNSQNFPPVMAVDSPTSNTDLTTADANEMPGSFEEHGVEARYQRDLDIALKASLEDKTSSQKAQ